MIYTYRQSSFTAN